MEKPEVKKQNNRKDDIKRKPDSKQNAPSKEKEWDPNKNEKDPKKENKLKILSDNTNND